MTYIATINYSLELLAEAQQETGIIIRDPDIDVYLAGVLTKYMHIDLNAVPFSILEKQENWSVAGDLALLSAALVAEDEVDQEYFIALAELNYKKTTEPFYAILIENIDKIVGILDNLNPEESLK